MADLADAFVALLGGLGTLEEFFEVWTWAQLGLHAKPVALLRVADFFDPLMQFLDSLVSHGFVRREHRDLLIVDDDPVSLLARLDAWRPPPIQPKWRARPGMTSDALCLGRRRSAVSRDDRSDGRFVVHRFAVPGGGRGPGVNGDAGAAWPPA